MATNIELLDSIISQANEIKQIVEKDNYIDDTINNDLKNIDGDLDGLLDYMKDE
jgi:hypothetical protein